ncbi:MAG: tetratricopeptide repeat protein [Magnetococcales bacterium]|nr:tetratricopeptide repeat protein [Magnetococcales bacterium]
MQKTTDPKQSEQPELTLKAAYKQAVDSFNSGDLAEADRVCSAILNEAPNYVDAINLLGIIAQRVNRHDLAVELFMRAISVDNSNALLYFNLGTSLYPLGRIGEAIDSYQKAIAIMPNNAQVHYHLGLALLGEGSLDKAVLSFQKAIESNPDYVESLSELGYTQHLLGLSDLGAESLKRAISIQASYVNAHYNLGVIHQAQGKFTAAISSYKNTIALTPEFFNAHYNLGVIYQAEGKIDDAILSYKNTLAIKPDYPQAHYNLGVVLQIKRQIDAAILSYKSAIAIKPDYAQAHSNLGAALQEQGEHEEAIISFKKAIEIEPGLTEAHYNYAFALQEQGKYVEAVARYQQTLICEPGYVQAHNNLIFCADLMPEVNSELCYAHRENWNKIHAEPLKALWPTLTNSPEPNRKLRIGYVGADFQHHSAAHIFGPMLLNYDRKNFAVFCYAGNTIEDGLTESFKANSTGWLSTSRIDDARLAEIIKNDAIDILVDLAGHTKGNRLLTFARKPAPIQISAWGYPLGTSMSAMDYLFGDSFFIPLADRHMYTEQIIDIPCAIHLKSATNFPPVTEPPVLKSGYITFGAFNRLEKYNDEVYTLWAEILNLIPNAKLLIKTAKLDSPLRIAEVEIFFSRKGVANNRLILLGKTSHEEHLKAHGLIDIMLDPFPHNSGMTSLESLRMGVPVLTCEKKIRCPASSAMLHILGLDEWNTQDTRQYIAKAVKFAADIEQLKVMREQLRDRFDASVLGNSQLYVGKVEAIYRQLWQKWCKAKKRDE